MNFIFDFDGTLFNSYDSISLTFHNAFLKFGINLECDYIKEYILTYCSSMLINDISKKYGVSKDDIKEAFDSACPNLELITVYNGVEDCLKALNEKKHNLFIYTHRGESSTTLLQKFNIDKYFKEIVDSTYHFKQKPNPEAIDYLVDKYHLDKEKTYYVGDREIDILCAINAHIKCIFFASSGIKNDSCKYCEMEFSSFKELEEKFS